MPCWSYPIFCAYKRRLKKPDFAFPFRIYFVPKEQVYKNFLKNERVKSKKHVSLAVKKQRKSQASLTSEACKAHVARIGTIDDRAPKSRCSFSSDDLRCHRHSDTCGRNELCCTRGGLSAADKVIPRGNRVRGGEGYIPCIRISMQTVQPTVGCCTGLSRWTEPGD